MTSRTKVIVSWSGGKDSLMALWKLSADYEVVALLTNLNAETERVSIHGVRRPLIELQAAALDLPVHFVLLPASPTNSEYEALVAQAIAPFQAEGVRHIVYGDLFLQDIRQYRDAFLQRLHMTGIYPLWEINTTRLINDFIEAGFKSLLTCVDTTQFDAAFVGRTIDQTLLHDLPAKVDPCGENGEFHTFVYDGSLFRQPIPIHIGDTWLQDQRFYFCDVT